MIRLDDIRTNRVAGVLAAYVVVAFAILEGLDILQAALGLPDVLLTVAAVLALAGLPVAGGLAWYTRHRERPVAGAAATDAEGPGAAPAESAGSVPASTAAPTSRSWRVVMVGAVAALLVAGGGWWASAGDPPSGPSLEPGLVAVLPFATGGADADLEWLEQGAMDLLAAKLTGEFGPRAVDPRTVLSRRDFAASDGVSDDRAVRWARSLGAGHVLTGSVVGSPARFTLSATLIDAATGDTQARASVRTDADEFPDAVDRLVIALLSLDAGEAEHRLATLTSADPGAVRDYLRGQSLYREGRYHASAEAFERALNADSTFALAGLGLSAAAGMGSEPQVVARAPRGRALAAAARENLSPLDRRFLEADAHARAQPTTGARIRAYEAGVRELPGSPELWYLLGDNYFHWGALADVQDHLDRARAAFDRALALDSLHYVAAQHLSWIAVMKGELGEARRLMEIRARMADPDNASFRMDDALARRDTQALRDFWSDLEHAAGDEIFITFWVGYGGWDRSAPDAPDRAVDRMLELATTRADLRSALATGRRHSLNAGRPGAALDFSERRLRAGADRDQVLQRRVLDALYWDGDAPAAAAAAAELEAGLGSTATDPAAAARARCAVLQWRAGEADPSADRHRASLAGALTRLDEYEQRRARLCLRMADALRALRAGGDRLSTAVVALDSALADGPVLDLREPANVLAARAFAALGEHERALRAATRMGFSWGMDRFWAPLKWLEARAADQLGDRARAREAYADLLFLLHDPEPAARDRAAEVRRRLAALSGEPLR